MSAHSEAMSQDEENQGNHLITLSNAQSGDTMYIVHHVNTLDDPLDQQIQMDSTEAQEGENQVMEMDEFLLMKQSLRKKMKSSQKYNARTRIKKEPDDSRGSPRGTRIHKNFSDHWLKSSVFKHWLEKHPTSITKAICKVCNKVLLAGKSELLKHGASKKHQQFLQASTGWLKNDDNSDDYNDNSADVSSEKDGNAFSEEWLEDPLYKDWVAPHPDSPFKALCKACNKVLLATKTDLMKHRIQKKHRVNMNTSGLSDVSYLQSAVDTCEDNGDVTINEYPLEEDKSTLFDENSETPIRVYRVKPSEISMPGTTSPFPPSKGTNEEETSQALVTQLAPSWKGKAVVNGHVQDLKLSDYRGRYVVMFFYPQDFSTVCSTEILALGDVISAFRVINCEVVAVSVDSHLAHLAWTKTLASSAGSNNRPEAPKLVPLLSDSTHSISRSYGCYLPAAGHSLRAYYIIDKRGVLRAMNISDIQVGRNLKEILRLVEAFQLVDSTNTQCPVNWTTGQPSVKVAL